eukprot:363127-Chlamydomonas_euryale.AAC.7
MQQRRRAPRPSAIPFPSLGSRPRSAPVFPSPSTPSAVSSFRRLSSCLPVLTSGLREGAHRQRCGELCLSRERLLGYLRTCRLPVGPPRRTPRAAAAAAARALRAALPCSCASTRCWYCAGLYVPRVCGLSNATTAVAGFSFSSRPSALPLSQYRETQKKQAAMSGFSHRPSILHRCVGALRATPYLFAALSRSGTEGCVARGPAEFDEW